MGLERGEKGEVKGEARAAGWLVKRHREDPPSLLLRRTLTFKAPQHPAFQQLPS